MRRLTRQIQRPAYQLAGFIQHDVIFVMIRNDAGFNRLTGVPVLFLYRLFISGQ